MPQYQFANAQPGSPEYYQALMDQISTNLAARRKRQEGILSEDLGRRGLLDSGQIQQGQTDLLASQQQAEGDAYTKLLMEQAQQQQQMEAEKRDEARQKRLLEFQAQLAKKRGMNRKQRALTGGLTGASSGAAAGGTAGGPWGALAGGLIGGGIGAYTGYEYGD